MSSGRAWKRLIFRWTAAKGIVAMVLFLALTVLIQHVLVSLFRSYGLTDTQTFPLPFTIISVNISPLFHLLPLGVVLVLISSWTYLTKNIAKVPDRRIPTKKPRRQRKPFKKAKQKRLKSFRKLSRTIRRNFQKAARALKAIYDRIKVGVLKIHGVSAVMQRLFFAKAAIRGTVIVVSIFLFSFLILNLMGFPSLLHDLAVGFYRSNPSFHGFVMGTFYTADSIGQALAPAGSLASAINGALVSASPAFRGALEGFVTSLTTPLMELELMGKYIVCQNAAAWISAIVALAYGQYASHLHRRLRK